MNRKQRRGDNRRNRTANTVPARGPEQNLAEAVDHHQAGRLGAAERLYRKVLDREPANADALHLLGVVCHQTDRDERAVELIGKALAANQGVALYHNNMGVSLRALDKADEAIPHFRRAVDLAPDYTDAYVNMGNALNATGATQDATAAYRKALQIDPDHADAHTALGTALMEAEDHTAAASHFRRAAELDPESALCHNNLGNVLAHENDTNGAIAEYRRAISLESDYADPHANLGAALRQAGKAEDAVGSLNRALALDPGFFNARFYLANALADLDRHTEAREAFEAALGIEPNHAGAHHNLGLTLEALGDGDEAEGEYRHAIAIEPNRAEAHNNLGKILSAMGRRDEAIAAFTAAIAHQADYEFAVSNRALVFLSLGRFAEGWRDYQMRDSIQSVRDTLWREPIPETLAGKNVFVLRDQGLGDEIFFLRFVRELKERGAWVGYRSQHPIAAMVARLPFLDQIFDEDDDASAPDGIDLCLSAGDLPHLLGMAAVSDIPPSIELAGPADRAAALRARLNDLGPPPYIGVTWRAGIQQRNKLSKIAPLDSLATVLAGTGGTCLALQRNPEAGEIERFAGSMGRELHDLTALNDDLEDMLAVMDLIDEYVCVSNTNTHLRAARGKPSRVLVPHPADYRWMDSGNESPWFPGTKIYRERPQAGWDAALEGLAADLAAAVPPGSERPGR